jgi:hypothetical protein
MAAELPSVDLPAFAAMENGSQCPNASAALMPRSCVNPRLDFCFPDPLSLAPPSLRRRDF